MAETAALKLALDLERLPSRAPHARSSALPSGMTILLRVAAGDREAIARAMELTARPEAALRDAAAFFIEQILLAPEADSYRVLGVDPSASAADIRRNMALLLKWLHPDVQADHKRSVFARRAAKAWDDIKTPERRAAYDEAQRNLCARNHAAPSFPVKRPSPPPFNRQTAPNAHPDVEGVAAPYGLDLRRAWRRARQYFLGGARL